MGENIGLGSVLPQSKKELHKQGTMHDFPSILAKRLIQRQGGQKLSLFVSFPKRGDASSNQPLNLNLGRMAEKRETQSQGFTESGMDKEKRSTRAPTKGGRPKRQRTTAPPSFPGSLPVKTTRREGI
ncbi:hypothetical protein L195_g019171 [Trifolium pratense]|uniref:Uncharacterized protein n=1 Tax=Trifolium pratense TaxID=57577 RepID=A0A2K3MYU6_TRIPR|nr:hypothetical protein L195_g019171 [Trifolium pratense]